MSVWQGKKEIVDAESSWQRLKDLPELMEGDFLPDPICGIILAASERPARVDGARR